MPSSNEARGPFVTFAYANTEAASRKKRDHRLSTMPTLRLAMLTSQPTSANTAIAASASEIARRSGMILAGARRRRGQDLESVVALGNAQQERRDDGPADGKRDQRRRRLRKSESSELFAGHVSKRTADGPEKNGERGAAFQPGEAHIECCREHDPHRDDPDGRRPRDERAVRILDPADRDESAVKEEADCGGDDEQLQFLER